MGDDLLCCDKSYFKSDLKERMSVAHSVGRHCFCAGCPREVGRGAHLRSGRRRREAQVLAMLPFGAIQIWLLFVKCLHSRRVSFQSVFGCRRRWRRTTRDPSHLRNRQHLSKAGASASPRPRQSRGFGRGDPRAAAPDPQAHARRPLPAPELRGLAAGAAPFPEPPFPKPLF